MERSIEGTPDVHGHTEDEANSGQSPQAKRNLTLDRTMFSILAQLIETPLISSTDLAALRALPRRTVLRRLSALEDAPYRLVTHWTPGCLGRGNAQLYLLTERGRAILLGPQTTGTTRRAESYEAFARISGAHPLSLLRLAPRLPAIVAAQEICTDLLTAATSMFMRAADHGRMTITARRWLRFPRYERKVGWLDHPLRLTFDGMLFLRCRTGSESVDNAERGEHIYQEGDVARGIMHYAVGVWLDDGECGLEQIAAQFWRLLTYRQELQIGSALFPRVVIATQCWERTDIWQAAAAAARAKSDGWMPEGIIVEGFALSASPWPLTVLGTPLGMEAESGNPDDTPGTTDDSNMAGAGDAALDAPLVIDLATGEETNLGRAFATSCDPALWTAWQWPTTSACAVSATVPRSVSSTDPHMHPMARAIATHGARPKSPSPSPSRDTASSNSSDSTSDGSRERVQQVPDDQPVTTRQPARKPVRSTSPLLPALLDATDGLLARHWGWADDLPTAARYWSQTVREVFGGAVSDLTKPKGLARTSLGGSDATPQTTTPEPIDPTEPPDQWEALTPLRRQLALCSTLLQLQRRHLEILALMGIAPLISTADAAFWLQCSEATIRRRVRDLRALGLCDEVLLPAPSAGLPSIELHHIEYGPLTCLRLRRSGRGLLAALYGQAAHRIPFKLRDIATPTAHDTGVHRFHSLLDIVGTRRTAQHPASTGSIGKWWCDEERCALPLERADGSGGAPLTGSPRGRRVVPDAVGEWCWTDPEGEEHSTAFWLEWDTGTESEAKLHDKLDRYTAYVRQEQEKHWADDTYQSPLLLFVVPDTERETWLASVARDLVANWDSWQHDLERESDQFVTAQPFPVTIYSTTIAHLAQARESPLSEIWLRIAPVPLDADALRTLKLKGMTTSLNDRGSQMSERQKQQKSSRPASRQPRSSQRSMKNWSLRLQDLWLTLSDIGHAHHEAHPPEAAEHSRIQTMLRRSCPLEKASKHQGAADSAGQG